MMRVRGWRRSVRAAGHIQPDVTQKEVVRFSWHPKVTLWVHGDFFDCWRMRASPHEPLVGCSRADAAADADDRRRLKVSSVRASMADADAEPTAKSRGRRGVGVGMGVRREKRQSYTYY